jgi:hypothetical protein
LMHADEEKKRFKQKKNEKINIKSN